MYVGLERITQKNDGQHVYVLLEPVLILRPSRYIRLHGRLSYFVGLDDHLLLEIDVVHSTRRFLRGASVAIHVSDTDDLRLRKSLLPLRSAHPPM